MINFKYYYVNILGVLKNQIDILAIISDITNTQNISLSPPTSPIGEKIIYKNMIAEKRFIETGRRNLQGAKSTTAFLGYLQGFGKGLKCPINSIIAHSKINKIAYKCKKCI